MSIIQYVKNLFKSKSKSKKAKPAKKAKADKPGAGLLPIGQYKAPFRLKASGILFPDGSLQTTACDGSGGGGGNEGGGDVNLDGLVTKEEFDDHEKRNVASFIVVEAEILKVANEVVFNYRDITELHQEIVPELREDIKGKASLSEDNIFNGKQVFNKNITFKGAETAIVPTLSSRWHKFSVNPPKNEDGTNNTDDGYGVNFWIDAGNTFKNKFQISNRKGAIFEARGGEYPEGQLYKNWIYSGEQTKDDSIATVKYVNTVVNDYAVPLDGNTVKTGNLVLQSDVTTPFEIKEANGTPVFTMWKSGAVAIEKPYNQFKDNELVTKAYVDSQVGGGAGSTGFAPVSEYDYYYLDMEGTSAGRITLCDGNGARTGNLKIIRAIIFNGVDANGKRWARDKDAVSYEKPYTGVANLMTEEGKVVATVGSSGKSTGFSTLHYYKDAIPNFISADTYILEIANSEGLAVTSDITEITYPQKLHLHVSGLHF